MAPLSFLGSDPAEVYGLHSPALSPTLDHRNAAAPGVVPRDRRRLSPAQPTLLDSLLRNLNFDLEAVTQVIDPILTARNYCHRGDYYLQGIILADQCFIASNLNRYQDIQITPCGSRWLIGRGAGCKIMLPDWDVSFYHASLSFDAEMGFCLTDLASSAGTLINHQRLSPAQPQGLQDGDMVQLGKLRLEFLQELCLTDPL
ncbi:MAG: FHA domain-containing protein [Cyanobacteria bacterium REEB459]|nr:FHA domain-containing protein [Cyanobacteria bacterium REEB459]